MLTQLLTDMAKDLLGKDHTYTEADIESQYQFVLSRVDIKALVKHPAEDLDVIFDHIKLRLLDGEEDEDIIKVRRAAISALKFVIYFLMEHDESACEEFEESPCSCDELSTPPNSPASSDSE